MPFSSFPVPFCSPWFDYKGLLQFQFKKFPIPFQIVLAESFVVGYKTNPKA
jgi:hypothetical protein